MSRAFVLAVLLVAAAQTITAASPGELTPMVGTAEDSRLFAGAWKGTVTSADGRFAGGVEFRFTSDGALIFPPYLPARVMWVRLTPRGVSGALARYYDPVRKAHVYTVFEATLRDSTLSGVLRERVRMEWTEAATWSVSRVSDAR